MLRIGLTVVALASGSIVAHCLLIDGWARWVFNGHVISRIGRYSYSMYLFHLPIASALLWLFPNLKYQLDPTVLFVFEVASTIFFAALSFRFIERPILSLKKYFTYDGEVRIAIAPHKAPPSRKAASNT